jgi:Tol biopolymer transport system component
MTTTQKLVLAFFAAVQVALLVAGPATAVNPGRNGSIFFTSGREGPNDNEARLYKIKPTGAGLSAPLGIPGVQNRHPSLSPDRTKMVFAAGTPGSLATEEYDLFVHDFVEKTTTPLDATQLGDGLSSDHPAWSPDGGRIAYETQLVDNSVNRDIMVKNYPSSQPATPLTATAETDLKPAWSPDGETIYYAIQAATPPASNFQLAARPAAGGAPLPMNNTAADDYQPSISPDGSKICFTQQTTPGNPASAEIIVAELPGPVNPVNLSQDPTKGDINCAWSPDGRRIAYTNGVFSQGRLVMERSDNSEGLPTPITDDEGSNNFDGNADWAPDGSPECDDRTVSTEREVPLTLELECTDTGPEYEQTDPNGTVANGGQPQNGTLSDESPLSNPSTVLYTPNPGFTGTDRVVYTAFDDFGFATDEGTLTIEVRAPGGGGGGGGGAGRCAGRDATITGTAGDDVLTGTAGADVIAAGSGNDKVRGGKGRDLICGGGGKDRLSGGAGKDRLVGGSGNDRLSGGGGKDRLNGGAGKDRLSGGAGKDRLNGGSGRDRCKGGPGRDRQRKCEVSR